MILADDGYMLPSGEHYERWRQNADFNEEKYWNDRRATIRSADEVLEAREKTEIILGICKFLKTSPENMITKIEKLKDEVSVLKDQKNGYKMGNNT